MITNKKFDVFGDGFDGDVAAIHATPLGI